MHIGVNSVNGKKFLGDTGSYNTAIVPLVHTTQQLEKLISKRDLTLRHLCGILPMLVMHMNI